jgi:hypothetical protein
MNDIADLRARAPLIFPEIARQRDGKTAPSGAAKTDKKTPGLWGRVLNLTELGST